MNLWVKRAGQVLMASALFFFNCEEDKYLLGFRNPNKKFNVSYIEIPIESSVIALDSVRTSNFFFLGETNRYLIGTYNDPDMGLVSSSPFFQYFRKGITDDSLHFATYDSVSIQLRFDFYTYGPTNVSPQTISVYEISHEMKWDSLAHYFNRTSLALSPTPLATATFTKDPVTLDNFRIVRKDTSITIRFPLDPAFGQRLFNSAVLLENGATHQDSTYGIYNEFVKVFKGLAIVPVSGDKMYGINPSAEQSKIVVHYHINKRDSLELSIGAGVSYNRILVDRSGTELSGLNQYHQDFLPASNKRYVQSGTGLFTKLDFSNFFAFADTIPELIINSAELEIASVQPGPTGHYAPPSNLVLRILKPNNRQKTFSKLSASDMNDLTMYNGTLGFDFNGGYSGTPTVVEPDSVLAVIGDDQNRFMRLPFSSDQSAYHNYMTLFMQELFNKTEVKNKFRHFILYPESPSAAKSLNRAIFPKEGIKLKLYYTRPVKKN